ncbi:hypothetical protein H9P43_006075 [Blastocladiella emersonii ATCC 22665]|nr:hypothetical protein H9P43_006075 [Blastocladiella emersonii ATCC 22665]
MTNEEFAAAADDLSNAKKDEADEIADNRSAPASLPAIDAGVPEGEEEDEDEEEAGGFEDSDAGGSNDEEEAHGPDLETVLAEIRSARATVEELNGKRKLCPSQQRRLKEACNILKSARKTACSKFAAAFPRTFGLAAKAALKKPVHFLHVTEVFCALDAMMQDPDLMSTIKEKLTSKTFGTLQAILASPCTMDVYTEAWKVWGTWSISQPAVLVHARRAIELLMVVGMIADNLNKPLGAVTLPTNACRLQVMAAVFKLSCELGKRWANCVTWAKQALRKKGIAININLVSDSAVFICTVLKVDPLLLLFPLLGTLEDSTLCVNQTTAMALVRDRNIERTIRYVLAFACATVTSDAVFIKDKETKAMVLIHESNWALPKEYGQDLANLGLPAGVPARRPEITGVGGRQDHVNTIAWLEAAHQADDLYKTRVRALLASCDSKSLSSFKFSQDAYDNMMERYEAVMEALHE